MVNRKNHNSLLLWRILHNVGYSVEFLVSLFWGNILKLLRISNPDYYLVRGAPTTDFVDYMKTLLNEAIDVKIAVGELSHQIFETLVVIETLNKIRQNNKANIEIIHGPNVDPMSQSIYKMSNDNSISIFQCYRNFPHHFALLTDTNGQVTTIEINRHYDKPVQSSVQDKEGRAVRNQARSVFIHRHSKVRAATLMRIFRNRKTISIEVYSNPTSRISDIRSSVARDNNDSSLLGKLGYLFMLALLKLAIHPAAVIFDRNWDIDFHEWVIEAKAFILGSRNLLHSDIPIPSNVRKFTEYPYSPEIEDLHKNIQAGDRASCLTLKDVLAFHRLEFGERSIANLNIDQDTFLKLAEANINTVDQLKLDSLSLAPNAIEDLRSAIDQYYQQIEDAGLLELIFDRFKPHLVHS